MKKTIKIAMVAVVAAVAGMGIYSSQKADVASDIALANVEALAQGEVDFPYICIGYVWDCYDDYYHQYFQGNHI